MGAVMTQTLTRADIANSIYQALGLSYTESLDIVDSVIEELVQALERKDSVKLSSFGTFSVRQKNPRMGRNPKTKQEIPISARRVVTFHASSMLMKRINKAA